MRLVVALGGHALLQPGEELHIETQRRNVRAACEALAPVARAHDLAITHGNGPQVGLLAVQNAMQTMVPPFPLDVLDAETQGMIGYLIERELGNRIGFDELVATVLTMVEVGLDDPAFDDPVKPIGPSYAEEIAAALAADHGWTFRRDGDRYRRVVPSPAPRRIIELQEICALLARHGTVVCAGGGGIPTAVGDDGELVGVEAVVDKDLTSAVLGVDIGAQRFVITTDVDFVYLDWGSPAARPILRAHPDALEQHLEQFDAGSMRPKVVAACQFVSRTGGVAAIGDLAEISAMLLDEAGTVVTLDADGLELGAAANRTNTAS